MSVVREKEFADIEVFEVDWPFEKEKPEGEPICDLELQNQQFDGRAHSFRNTFLVTISELRQVPPHLDPGAIHSPQDLGWV